MQQKSFVDPSREKLRVAVICNEDKLWSLLAWNRVFKSVYWQDSSQCIGFWICENKFGRFKKKDVTRWYLDTFGLFNFLKLGVFATIFKLYSIYKAISGKYHLSYESLCAANRVSLFKLKDPNDDQLVHWIEENEIDVLIVMVGHILKPKLIHAPKICTINKHASLLPSNKGVFPYIWAKINNTAQGVSFHKVVEEIDGGEILFQKKLVDAKTIRSMISFYSFVYYSYDTLLANTLGNILNERSALREEAVESSYFSFPNKDDIKIFSNAGGKIILLTDLLLPLKML